MLWALRRDAFEKRLRIRIFGCTMSFDQYGNLDYVTCFYVNTCVGNIKNM